jgi:multicomponent Na+:H+ antiporter subunit D
MAPMVLYLLATRAAAKVSAPPPVAWLRGFDPSSTLPWSVPILLIAPLAGLLILLLTVRSRRSAAGLALFSGAATLLDALVVAWARFGNPSVYRATLPWINVSVSFGGDPKFQGFGIDITQRITHEVLALLVGLLVIFMACLLWHRLAGRHEQGAVRSQAAALLLLLTAIGVLVAGDLASLFAFWVVAGVATYLLLGNRWGSELGARGAQVALTLPFLGDLALLCAVALLYSRFGATDIDKLVPMLGHTASVGLKSTSVMASLLLLAVGVRAAVWPFTAWQTATIDAPPAFSALVVAVWALLAGHLLFISLPEVAAAGPQPARVAAWLLAAGAIAGPLLSLLTFELRRSIVLASSGGVALCLLATLYPGSASAGLTGLLAVAGGRAAALLGTGWVEPSLQTADLRLMGDGQRRMPWALAGLAAGIAAATLAAVAGSSWRHQSWAWIALLAALALGALALGRIYGAVALGEVPKRRAFEPTRIRDASPSVAAPALVCAALGLLAGVLAFVPAWTSFFLPFSLPPGGGGAAPAWNGELVWLAPVIAGLAFGLIALRISKVSVLGASSSAARLYWSIWHGGQVVWGKWVAPGLLKAIGAVELRALPGIEDDFGQGLTAAGLLLERRLPYLPALAGLAILVGLVLGLLIGERGAW